MSLPDDLRLIEDYLPIEAISAESSREKSVRKGHISTLHLWWARRPLVACRAAVYGALVPADRWVKDVSLKNPPKDAEKATRSKNGKKKGLNRRAAKEFVERLCKYPGEPKVIADAQNHILESHAERLTRELTEANKSGIAPSWVEEFNFANDTVTYDDIVAGRAPRPRVLDMFAGGGAIPLEAQRLGCESYAFDLNPVAHIIQLCTLVYPQTFGKPAPSVRGMTGPKDANGQITWGGLEDEVRYWGNWVLKRVSAEIGDLYPFIPDPKKKPATKRAAARSLLDEIDYEGECQVPPGFLMPVAYLWTRTVRCKNPACGATVPLVKQTWLCKKKGRYAALKPIVAKNSKTIRFDVVEVESESKLGFDPTAFSSGGNATCPFCGTVADTDYVKSEGCAKRLGQQLMALVATRQGESGKIYLSTASMPDTAISDSVIADRITSLCARSGLTVPNEQIVDDAKNSFWVRLYGNTTFGDLFLPRQLLCLLTFSAETRMAYKAMLESGLSKERATALTTYLAALVDRLADFNSANCTWNYTGGRGVIHSLPRQAIPMAWDSAETNPFNPKAASWISAVADVPRVFDDLSSVPRAGHVFRTSATTTSPLPNETLDAVITDPPYYDNVSYADISDFFYVWLKRTIGDLFPEHFAADGTPKKAEAVADATRHGGDKSKAKNAYETMMDAAFTNANRCLKPNGQMTVVYAHKTTLGWSTLVDSLRRACFTVTEAWPLDTERSGRLLAMDSAALASSIFLVARKRPANAGIGSYEEHVQSELIALVRERVETLWDMGIAGADLVIACVGAGLRAFTKYEHVEYANGEVVPSEKFLAEVEGVVLDTMMGKLFGQSGAKVSAIDAASRFYVLWRFVYKASDIDAGEAIVFTYAQHVELDGPLGLSAGKTALVEKKKAKYRARDFTERGNNDKLGLRGDDGLPAPLIDVLHRALWLLEHSPRKLSEFLIEADPDRERLRLLAQALAGAALAGKSEEDADKLIGTTAAEKAALGKLLANWKAVIENAVVSIGERSDKKTGQKRLEF